MRGGSPDADVAPKRLAHFFAAGFAAFAFFFAIARAVGTRGTGGDSGYGGLRRVERAVPRRVASVATKNLRSKAEGYGCAGDGGITARRRPLARRPGWHSPGSAAAGDGGITAGSK